ncbi:ester cyclase [Candidatus Poribacteria bacterium]|nr:ester cyclase [Candidatus Poribacteria bacterium]
MFHKISTLFLVCLMLIAISSVLQASADIEANKALVRRLAEEFWNTGNVGRAGDFFAPNYHRHDPGLTSAFYAVPAGEIVGLEAFKAWVAPAFVAVPGFHVIIEDIIAEGDKVAVLYTIGGTFAPTGLPFKVTVMQIARLQDGLIVEDWYNADNLGWERQIGLLPYPESGAATPPVEVGVSRSTGPGDPKANSAFAYLWVKEFWNIKDAERADDFFAPNYVRRDPGFTNAFYAVPGGQIVGLEAFKAWVAQIFAGVPDLHITLEDTVAEGNRVVGRYTLRGTFAPTGLPFEVSCMNILRLQDGLIIEEWLNCANLNQERQIGLLPSPPPQKDFSQVFFAALSEGLNMISLPLEPQAPLTARAFAQTIGATVIIKLDEKAQRFVGFTLDAPDNGFPIEGGAGYIVNTPQAREVAFVGAAWTNQPAVKAAPASVADALNGRWAFVVSGRFAEEAAEGYLVRVRNIRTNAVAADVIRSGYFAAAFADLTRKSVVEVGDRLQVTVHDSSGEIVSGPFEVTVTPEALRQAFLSAQLERNGKPNQSLLLQNYPNPFNPETWMPYQLREATTIAIRIYDSHGGLVRTLDLGHRPTGFYHDRLRAAYWDGRNDAGEKVASGVYFYELHAGDFSAVRRMVILK